MRLAQELPAKYGEGVRADNDCIGVSSRHRFRLAEGETAREYARRQSKIHVLLVAAFLDGKRNARGGKYLFAPRRHGREYQFHSATIAQSTSCCYHAPTHPIRIKSAVRVLAR